MKKLNRSYISLYSVVQHEITVATYDIITATDDVTAATDDVMYLTCMLLQHHNCRCYGNMTSYFKMSAKTRHFVPIQIYFLNYTWKY